jgi:hypothetical protein
MSHSFVMSRGELETLSNLHEARDVARLAKMKVKLFRSIYMSPEKVGLVLTIGERRFKYIDRVGTTSPRGLWRELPPADGGAK